MASLKEFQKLLVLKRYSANTQKSYAGLLKAFFTTIGEEHPEKLNAEVAVHKAGAYIVSKKYKYNTQKQFLGALNLFFNTLHNRKINFKALYPTQKPNYIPEILSLKEVKTVIEHTNNLKHRAMLSCIYALGLRSGELLNLKLPDIDGTRKLVHIKKAKGNKDRIIPLPPKLHILLREYYKKYKPSLFLFEGQKGGKYTSASLRKVFLNACIKASVKKQVTTHSLRHSYATHLLEKGTDVRVIQKLLGHESITTTMLYTKITDVSMAKVESPFEDL